MNLFSRITLFKSLVGDGRLGYPSKAPYDAIHVGAAAPDTPSAVSLSIFYILLKMFNWV